MRLSPKELAVYRGLQAAQQGNRCLLCNEPFTDANPPVVDHCHTTGRIRGILHRGCNSMLGVIENNRARYQLLKSVRLARFASRLSAYLEGSYGDKPIYPTHRTDEEKRLLRNKRARAARAKAKVKE